MFRREHQQPSLAELVARDTDEINQIAAFMIRWGGGFAPDNVIFRFCQKRQVRKLEGEDPGVINSAVNMTEKALDLVQKGLTLNQTLCLANSRLDLSQVDKVRYWPVPNLQTPTAKEFLGVFVHFTANFRPWLANKERRLKDKTGISADRLTRIINNLNSNPFSEELFPLLAILYPGFWAEAFLAQGASHPLLDTDLGATAKSGLLNKVLENIFAGTDFPTEKVLRKLSLLLQQRDSRAMGLQPVDAKTQAQIQAVITQYKQFLDKTILFAPLAWAFDPTERVATYEKALPEEIKQGLAQRIAIEISRILKNSTKEKPLDKEAAIKVNLGLIVLAGLVNRLNQQEYPRREFVSTRVIYQQALVDAVTAVIGWSGKGIVLRDEVKEEQLIALLRKGGAAPEDKKQPQKETPPDEAKELADLAEFGKPPIDYHAVPAVALACLEVTFPHLSPGQLSRLIRQIDEVQRSINQESAQKLCLPNESWVKLIKMLCQDSDKTVRQRARKTAAGMISDQIALAFSAHSAPFLTVAARTTLSMTEEKGFAGFTESLAAMERSPEERRRFLQHYAAVRWPLEQFQDNSPVIGRVINWLFESATNFENQKQLAILANDIVFWARLGGLYSTGSGQARRLSQLFNLLEQYSGMAPQAKLIVSVSREVEKRRSSPEGESTTTGGASPSEEPKKPQTKQALLAGTTIND